MSSEKNDREQRTALPAEQNELVPVQPQEVKVQNKNGLMRSVGDFFENTFGGGKNQDLGGLMEDFTSEMTLVAEGLSQDQDRLNERCARLEARQAEGEERLSLRLDEIGEALHEQDRDRRDADGKAARQWKEFSARLDKLEERAQRMETALEESKKAENAKKKEKSSDKWSGILRQATWLAGILCGAWVLTTLINKFF